MFPIWHRATESEKNALRISAALTPHQRLPFRQDQALFSSRTAARKV